MRPLLHSLVDRAAAVVIVVTAEALRTVEGATRRILTSPRLPFRFSYAVLSLGDSAAIAEAVSAGVPAPGRSRSRFGGFGGVGDHQCHRPCRRRWEQMRDETAISRFSHGRTGLWTSLGRIAGS